MDKLPKLSSSTCNYEVEDWPFGRQTCKAQFTVEGKLGKERVARVTENKARTGWNKPKRTTYSYQARIVQGDDGKTYIIRNHWSHINVMEGTLKFEAGNLWPQDEQYAEVLALFS